MLMSGGLIAKGRLEGRQEGMLKGRLEGRLEGMLKGRLEGKLEVAQNMVQRGMAFADIAAITGLKEDELKKNLGRTLTDHQLKP